MALLATTLAIGCGDSGESTASNRDRQAAPPANSLIPDFSVFKGPRSSEDEIPLDLLPVRVAAAYKLDRSESRRARLYRGQPVFVLSSRDLTCTFSRRNEVVNCWPTATVKQGLASGASICGLGTDSSKSVVYGLLPDGVREVTVPSAGGSAYSAPVVGNVYALTVRAEPPLPQRLSYFQGGRRVVIPTGIPADVARNGCGNAIPVPRRTSQSGASLGP